MSKNDESMEQIKKYLKDDKRILNELNNLLIYDHEY